MSYRGVWTGCVGLTCAAGVGLAMLELGPLVAVLVVLLLAGAAAVFVAVLPAVAPTPRVVATRSLGIGSTVLAGPAIARLSPYLALSALLLLGLGAPWLLERVRAACVADLARPDLAALEAWLAAQTGTRDRPPQPPGTAA